MRVFSTLKSTLQASDEDCVFGPMFEEMLIGKNLCSIHKFSCMEGFEDLRNHSRTSNIANHACPGLHAAWFI